VRFNALPLYQTVISMTGAPYQHGGLDDKQKQLIPAHRETIRCAHTDHPRHWDHGDSQDDEAWAYDLGVFKMS
jgi:hypothetical protein